MNEIENAVIEESKVWETFDRGQIEQIIQGNIRSVDEKMGQLMDLFITSGYYLRRQYQEKQYLDAGYERFEDYVKDRYGKSRSWATRMMQISEKYSIGGNDPRIDPKYKGYGISQLQEMLYLTDEQRENVSPDMTVKEIRALKEPEPEVEEEQLPGQMSVEDYPEVLPEAVEQKDDEERGVTLRKPTSEEQDIMKSLARKLIKSKYDWFIADHYNRVLNVTSGEIELKKKVANEPSRTWYFKHGDDICHGNLFDEYVQLWNRSEWVGNFDWFYLAAAIQTMWNVLAMESAQERIATSQKSPAGQYHDGEISKEELWNGMATNSVAAETAQNEETCCEKCSTDQPEESDVELGEPDDVIDAEYTEVTETVTPQSLLEEAKKWLDDYIKCDAPKNLIEKQKIYVGALASMVCDLEDAAEEPEPPKQPELPVMKNNDQRKAFIDAYTTWPIWIDIKETGERYYRYEFPEQRTAFVVKVYFHRCFDCHVEAERWQDKFREDWGAEEYYLILPEKFFKDCSTKRTALMEYLRDIQKK